MPEDLYERMIRLDPDFKKFVEALKDKTTEEIAAKYGIKLVNTRKSEDNFVTNL